MPSPQLARPASSRRSSTSSRARRIFGAILLTGYLGGAVATHVRVEAEKFTFLMPVVFAALIWGGLFFRDARIRNLLPWRK